MPTNANDEEYEDAAEEEPQQEDNDFNGVGMVNGQQPSGR